MADNGTTPPPFDIAHFMGGLIMELGIALMYAFNFSTSAKLWSHTYLHSDCTGWPPRRLMFICSTPRRIHGGSRSWLLQCGKLSYVIDMHAVTLFSSCRVLETLHTAFMLRQIYYYTIISFGDYEGIAKIDWWGILSNLTSANLGLINVPLLTGVLG